MNPTILLNVQDDAAARLAADPFFSDIKILTERKGVVASDIERALGTMNSQGGKVGAVCIVLMPEVETPRGEEPGPGMELLLDVQVLEKPLINLSSSGTGKTAEEIAMRVTRLLHRFWAGNYGGMLNAKGIQANGVEDGVKSYTVRLGLFTGLDPALTVMTPAIHATGSLPTVTVALTCGTPGATIRYTTDGSYPGATATAYTTPFAIASATTVRAVAYLAGQQASDLAHLEIE